MKHKFRLIWSRIHHKCSYFCPKVSECALESRGFCIFSIFRSLKGHRMVHFWPKLQRKRIYAPNFKKHGIPSNPSIRWWLFAYPCVWELVGVDWIFHGDAIILHKRAAKRLRSRFFLSSPCIYLSLICNSISRTRSEATHFISNGNIEALCLIHIVWWIGIPCEVDTERLFHITLCHTHKKHTFRWVDSH